MLKFVLNVIHSIQVSRKLQELMDVLISSIRNMVSPNNWLTIQDKVEVA